MQIDLPTAARALWRGMRHARAAVDKSQPSLKHRNLDTSGALSGKRSVPAPGPPPKCGRISRGQA